ncbi:PucR family transcriptional regulator [Amycolatopsis sp. CA-230715]|uniref:PucR family transcriptional regulator n=1 Tax=Amycolatopsis sp. CA-230715 TaxID=2745196 RepID=UPI001C01B7C3|nr:helix-turn-helix domain-containing protein [Amycolatopsis sp. CA-230715]QWF81288.1 hypothetical protein HUW46_04718 [Amycolatopsis sp. CA-230715]
MRSLLLRLSSLDADAESAVRVIGFFDALVTAGVRLPELVRQCAKLAECPVGLASGDVWLRADPEGGLSTSGEVPGDAVVRGTTWLERGGDPGPLDEMLLERFAISAALLGRSELGFGDPALVELVLADSTGDAERARALHLLGIADPRRAIAFTSEDPGAVGSGYATIGRVHALLVPPGFADGWRAPDGVRAGIGPVADPSALPESWRAAKAALRFAGHGGPPVIRSETLGALSVLARLSAEDLADVGDLAALDRLAAEPHGADLLTVLAAFIESGSVRKTATAVYRHHSTIASRIAHAERALGFEVGTPDGRFRLHLAFLLRRLRDA